MSSEERNLACTTTGELYQPIRLYYRIYDRKLLLKKLKKLKCTQFDSKGIRWVWLYADESKDLLFENGYDSLPSECQGNLVLGSFSFHGNSHICLDVPSHERGLYGLEFFDEQLSRDSIQVEHIDILNCLFSLDEIKHVKLSKLLDNPHNVINSIPTNPDSEFPIIEVRPLDFYNDGLSSVKLILSVRQIIAKKRWLGDYQFKTSDIFKNIISDMGNVT